MDTEFDNSAWLAKWLTTAEKLDMMVYYRFAVADIDVGDAFDHTWDNASCKIWELGADEPQHYLAKDMYYIGEPCACILCLIRAAIGCVGQEELTGDERTAHTYISFGGTA